MTIFEDRIKEMSKNEVNIRNKRARFEYHLMDEFVAGMQLTGTEIKLTVGEVRSDVPAIKCTAGFVF